MTTLDRHGLVDYIDEHYRQPGDRLFRLEQRPLYADNADNLARWRAGDTEPDWDSGWSRILADEHDRGLIQQRVRVLSADLTDDERASCLLAYPTNGRYEDIRVLHRGEHDIPAMPSVDYWLIRTAAGEVHVLAMVYGRDGDFLTAKVEDDLAAVAEYATAADRLVKAAEPFSSWWPRHAPDLVHGKAA